MVAPCTAVLIAHALLDDSPLFIFSHKEGVMVELVACLDCCIINFSSDSACVSELSYGLLRETKLFANCCDVTRCFAGGFSFASTHTDAVLFRR